jgi:hypothetical protein
MISIGVGLNIEVHQTGVIATAATAEKAQGRQRKAGSETKGQIP